MARRKKTIDWVAVYIKMVEDGEILVPKTIQAQIERHQKDLEEAKNNPEYPYYFDIEEAKKPIDFIEMLIDPKSRQPMRLATFQKFTLSLLYGWRRKDNGLRRFRKAFISLARKQGKSLLITGIALYGMIMENEPRGNRQIYFTANAKDQARQAFDKMLKPQLRALCSSSKWVKKNTKILGNEVLFKHDEATVKPLASDTDTLDGLDVYIGILDEYAYSKNNKMMEVLESSQGQQLQPMILIISTAGDNLNSPMYTEEYPYSKEILRGNVSDDYYLPLIWEQDSLEEIADSNMWIKSNPLLEVEELQENLYEYLNRKLSEAVAKGNATLTYTKNFNRWYQSTNDSFLTADEWADCVVQEPYDIEGRDIYIGIDLSKFDDLSAISWAIPIEEEERVLVDSFSFVGCRGGIQNKSKRDNVDYLHLEREGYCQISQEEGGIINYHEVVKHVIDFVRNNKLNLKGIFYDSYNANNVVQDLSTEFGEEQLIVVRQGLKSLNPPTKQLRLDVMTKKIAHYNNPLLTRAVNNAVLDWKNDTFMVKKMKGTNKIDPLVALIDAYTEALYVDFTEMSADDYYNSDDFSF